MPGVTDTSKKDKIFIEKYEGKEQTEPLTVEVPAADKPNTGVFVGSCKGPGLCVIITGKIKNLTINNCTDMAVVIDDCITTVEVIGCKKVQIQAKSSAASYNIDKCDRTTLYFPDASAKDKCIVYSCMSTATNVCYSTPDGEDQVEKSIPDQVESTFKIGEEPKHSVVIPDAE